MLGGVLNYIVSFQSQNGDVFSKMGAASRAMSADINNSFNRLNRSVLYTRSNIQSMGGTSWQTFNSIARSSDAANKSVNNFVRGVVGAGVMGGFVTKLVQANSEMQTNEILFKSLIGNGQKATQITDMLQQNAAKYGQNMSEVFKASKGLFAGMAFQVGAKNVKTGDLDTLLKITETLSVLDVENRGLSYTAFSIKELLQGQGMADFRSLTNRLEVSLPKPTKEGITKAIKAHDFTKAAQILQDGLKKANVGENILLDLMGKGFAQNTARLGIQMDIMFQRMGQSVFNSLGPALFQVNDYLTKILDRNSMFAKSLQEIGQNIKYYVVEPFKSFVKWFTNPNPDYNDILFFGRLNAMFTQARDAAQGFLKVFYNVIAGFFNLDKVSNGDFSLIFLRTAQLMATISERFRLNLDNAYSFGQRLRHIFETIAGIITRIGYIGSKLLFGNTKGTLFDSALLKAGGPGNSTLDSLFVVGPFLGGIYLLKKVFDGFMLPVRILQGLFGGGPSGGGAKISANSALLAGIMNPKFLATAMFGAVGGTPGSMLAALMMGKGAGGKGMGVLGGLLGGYFGGTPGSVLGAAGGSMLGGGLGGGIGFWTKLQQARKPILDAQMTYVKNSLMLYRNEKMLSSLHGKRGGLGMSRKAWSGYMQGSQSTLPAAYKISRLRPLADLKSELATLEAFVNSFGGPHPLNNTAYFDAIKKMTVLNDQIAAIEKTTKIGIRQYSFKALYEGWKRGMTKVAEINREMLSVNSQIFRGTQTTKGLQALVGANKIHLLTEQLKGIGPGLKLGVGLSSLLSMPLGLYGSYKLAQAKDEESQQFFMSSTLKGLAAGLLSMVVGGPAGVALAGYSAFQGAQQFGYGSQVDKLNALERERLSKEENLSKLRSANEALRYIRANGRASDLAQFGKNPNFGQIPRYQNQLLFPGSSFAPPISGVRQVPNTDAYADPAAAMNIANRVRNRNDFARLMQISRHMPAGPQPGLGFNNTYNPGSFEKLSTDKQNQVVTELITLNKAQAEFKDRMARSNEGAVQKLERILQALEKLISVEEDSAYKLNSIRTMTAQAKDIKLTDSNGGQAVYAKPVGPGL